MRITGSNNIVEYSRKILVHILTSKPQLYKILKTKDKIKHTHTGACLCKNFGGFCFSYIEKCLVLELYNLSVLYTIYMIATWSSYTIHRLLRQMRHIFFHIGWLKRLCFWYTYFTVNFPTKKCYKLIKLFWQLVICTHWRTSHAHKYIHQCNIS